MSSDFNFTVICWFLGNVQVKPYFNTQCPSRIFRPFNEEDLASISANIGGVGVGLPLCPTVPTAMYIVGVALPWFKVQKGAIFSWSLHFFFPTYRAWLLPGSMRLVGTSCALQYCLDLKFQSVSPCVAMRRHVCTCLLEVCTLTYFSMYLL